MSATTKIGFEEFQELQEAADEATRYELDEGELIVIPSPSPWHNIVAFRLMRALAAFVNTHDLGLTLAETDFRLDAAVRKPDVAFIPNDRLRDLDLHHAPIQGAPALAVEVISPGHSAAQFCRTGRTRARLALAAYRNYNDPKNKAGSAISAARCCASWRKS
jgi:Uma2 family endonuclease